MLTISFDIGVVNLGVCILNDNQIILWETKQLFEKANKARDINTITRRIYEVMDEMMEELGKVLDGNDDYKVDYVLLENQPSRINGKMKTIQMILYGYFYNLKHYHKKVINIHHVNPTCKLAWVNDIERDGLSKYEQYKQNKTKSVHICKDIADGKERLQDMLKNAGSKKDDMCDALIQIIGFQKKNKINIDIDVII